MLERLVPTHFHTRLLVSFLALTLLPLIATGSAFFFVLYDNVRSETFSKLAFVRDAKHSEIRQYLDFATRQAESVSASSAMQYAIGNFYGFSYAFKRVGASPEQSRAILQSIFDSGDDIGPPPFRREPAAREYLEMHQRFHGYFADALARSEFDNLYLVTPEQRIVYSTRKDDYLGSSLTSTLSQSPLAGVVRAELATEDSSATFMSDFVEDPVTGAFAAYVGIRVQFYGKLLGVAIFRLNADGLSRIVSEQTGTASSLYLLNGAGQPIASTGNMPVDPAAAAERLADRLPESLETVRAGLAGEEALMASAAIGAKDLPWRLVAEIPASVAFSRSDWLRNVVALVALVSLPLLMVLAIYLSRSLTRPLQVLTDAAESLASGDLDHHVPAIEGPRELSLLTASFLRMRDAIREQLSLIGQKNRELESHVALIEDKNRELEEADRMKDTFVANTSHELRTPLNGIIGISETLAAGVAGALPAAQRKQLELIASSARRLSRLVDDLLDLYRMRQGRMRVDIHPVHLATSIRHVLQLSEPLLRGEPVALSVSVPDDLPFVMADPVRLEQILYNLLGNAIKYTAQGSIHIAARVEGGDVAVTVSDTGIGISPEVLERMFEPFEQGVAHDSMQKLTGSGLGLTVARQLATLLGGTLAARSSLGEGSTFTLELPAAAVETSGAYSEDATAVQPRLRGIEPMVAAWPHQDVPAPAGADTILVVDDEPINVQVLHNVLQPRGYAVRSAESGEAALRVLDETRPDLVILDVMMPGMSGFDVAKQIRQRYGLRELPIIMVTARSRTRDVIAGFEHGANDYVVKPFVKDELLARVATLLEASRSRGRAVENLELREEMERRVQVEDALRLSQQRMARLLDTLDAALFCCNNQYRITYANEAARQGFAIPSESGETDLGAVLGVEVVEAITAAMAEDGSIQIDKTAIAGSVRPVQVAAFELDPEAGGGIAVILTPSLGDEADQRQTLVRSVREAIDTVPAVFKQAGAVPAPNGQGQQAPVASAGEVSADGYRELILDVMTGTLALWRKATGKGKIEFAEQSGIWRVSLDHSSLQVRTLDKYLLIETLPLQPRWRDVVQSGEFVLDHVARLDKPDAQTAADCRSLAESLARLRSIVREKMIAPKPADPPKDEPAMSLGSS